MTNNIKKKFITKIVYSFKDASVPPQYHRSYSITVTRHQLHIIVNSYGDILADKTIDIPEHTIDDLVRDTERYQIKAGDRKSDTTIYSGGISKSLTIYSNENILLNGAVYQFGDHLEGSLSGDIDSFAKKVESLIPDFTDLLK